MTREEVLEEFRSDACDCECEAWDCIVDKAMADEIVRLRKQNAIVVSMLTDQIPLLNRLQDTVDALREPSEAVVKAAVLHYSGDLQDAIRAAVAAAEAEASHGARATKEASDES